ncbi:hypothetical protein [Xanthomonas tesorieronis]|uniref:hypothetical protein n=1 Tax=Xanthomonas tesorieronis TaxID=3160839 RepID=UPI003514D14F
MSSKTTLVHFVGGPADGEKRHIAEYMGTFRVAESPELGLCASNSTAPERVIAKVHTYVIRQVGRRCVVAVHEDLA